MPPEQGHSFDQVVTDAMQMLRDLEVMIETSPGEPLNGSTPVQGLAASASDASALGLEELQHALSSVVRACDGANEPEAMYPSSVTEIRDAIDGSRRVLEAMSLGELRESVKPPSLGGARFRRTDVGVVASTMAPATEDVADGSKPEPPERVDAFDAPMQDDIEKSAAPTPEAVDATAPAASFDLQDPGLLAALDEIRVAVAAEVASVDPNLAERENDAVVEMMAAAARGGEAHAPDPTMSVADALDDLLSTLDPMAMEGDGAGGPSEPDADSWDLGAAMSAVDDPGAGGDMPLRAEPTDQALTAPAPDAADASDPWGDVSDAAAAEVATETDSEPEPSASAMMDVDAAGPAQAFEPEADVMADVDATLTAVAPADPTEALPEHLEAEAAADDAVDAEAPVAGDSPAGHAVDDADEGDGEVMPSEAVRIFVEDLASIAGREHGDFARPVSLARVATGLECHGWAGLAALLGAAAEVADGCEASTTAELIDPLAAWATEALRGSGGRMARVDQAALATWADRLGLTLPSGTSTLPAAADSVNPMSPVGPMKPMSPMIASNPANPMAPSDPTSPMSPMSPAAPEELNVPATPMPASATTLPVEEFGGGDEWQTRPVMVADDQIEPFQFMVAAAQQQAEEIVAVLADAAEFTSRSEASERLVAIAGQVSAACAPFGLTTIPKIMDLLARIGARLNVAPEGVLPEVFLRVRALKSLMEQALSGLQVGMELSWPLGVISRRLDLLLSGKRLHHELVAWHNEDPDRVLELDRVTEGVDTPPNPAREDDDGTGPSANAGTKSAGKSGGEAAAPTVRVSRPALEELMDLARQLVLNKNQVQSLAGVVRRGSSDGQVHELLTTKADEYGRLVDRLQAGLTAARVQPVSRLLDPYRKTIHDVAQIKDRDVELEIVGGETEVDKFTIDELAEPIGRLLRYAASESIESPTERERTGKPRRGMVKVSCADRGSHVEFVIEDDGKGWSTEGLLERALASGRVTQEAFEAMDESSRWSVPLEAWCPESDLAGVADPVRAMGATIEAACEPGRWTRYTITVPVRGAVIDAIRARVGSETYAFSVRAVGAIVRVADHQAQTIHGRPTLRVREDLMPLIDAHRAFGTGSANGDSVALIVNAAGEKAAIQVDAIIGHQEVVIDHTGLDRERQGPFLGATIEDDGRVALVVDVERMVREAGAGPR